MLFLMLSVSILAIEITSNSPADNTYYNNDTILFNLTSSEEGSGSLFIDLYNSLVSWWRMDDINATGDPTDYTGRNNGTIIGGASQTDSGYFGKGFIFDGNYVDCGNDASLNISNNLTIGAWIKRVGRSSSSADTGTILGKDINSNTGYVLEVHDDDALYPNLIRVTLYGLSTSNFRSNTQTLQDQWYHIVVTYNGTNAVLYINGGVDKNQATTGDITTSTDTVKIGYSKGSGNLDNYFNGTIDDVMIFNRSLTSDEVLALYNSTAIYHNETFSEGEHTFTVYSQNTSGNVSTDTITFTVDLTYPNVTINAPTASESFTTSSILLNVSLSENGTCMYSTDEGVTNTSMDSDDNQIFTKSLSLSNGDHTVNFYCNDSAGNLNSTINVSFSVSLSVEEIEDMPPSGGGTPTYYPQGSELEQGYSKSLGRLWKVNFEHENEPHQLEVEKIYSTNKSATITIYSIPQTKTISVGEEWKVNLNNDSTYDLLVRLDNVTSIRANVFIQEINESISGDEEIQQEPQTQEPETTTDEIGCFGGISCWYYIVGGGFTVLIIAAGSIYLIFQRKK